MSIENAASPGAVRADVLAAAQELYRRELVVGTSGNVSGRVDDRTICVTPSSLPYEAMTVEDLVLVDPDGTVLEGVNSPTSEKSLHLACYRNYPEVRGVVHCHARYASMFAVAGEPIPAAIDEFVVYVGGDVPVCHYHPSGTAALGDAVAAVLGDRSAALMANHGLVCVGKSVDDALHTAMVVEHNAQIMWGALQLGRAVEIPVDSRDKFGGVYEFVRHNLW